MKKIYLASKSPRRQELFNLLKIPYQVITCDIDEENSNSLTPYEYVKEISEKKAIAANEILDSHEDSLIISADTIVVYKGDIIGKPKDFSDAFNTLKKLSGQKHSVYTGLTILNSIEKTYKLESIVESSYVYFSDLTDTEIENYIKTNEPFDKAGSYAIQGLGGMFVEKIEGDYFNIVGLPINKLRILLKNFDIDITHFMI